MDPHRARSPAEPPETPDAPPAGYETPAPCRALSAARVPRAAADGRVTAQTGSVFVSAAGCSAGASRRQRLSARSTVGLILAETRIGGCLRHGFESRAGAVHLGDGQGTIDRDER